MAGVRLLPEEALAVQRYAQARRSLGSVNPVLLGFQMLGADDALLSADEAARLVTFCHSIEWEPRLGSGGVPIAGTQRKSFGVATQCATSYSVAPGSAQPLPPLLAQLGDRLLCRCRALPWPFASTSIEKTKSFEQAYVQVYPGCSSSGGEPTGASTLGFHFDERGCYGELIVGVTLCGTAKLLLAGTNGSEFVDDVASVLRKPNVLSVPLTPRSAYAMTGLARYDLRHAVVNDGDKIRISVTFRSCPKARPSGRDSSEDPSIHAHSAGSVDVIDSCPGPASDATHALGLLQMPLAPMPTSASRFDHAACFGGSGVVSMREVIAEGTCIPHFRSSVSALVRLNRAEGSAHPRIDGSGVAPEHSSADLLALAASSSSSELSDGEEEDSRDPPDAAIRLQIAQRASAPCGHTPCRFDGACFRRDASHWLRYAHPRETVKEYCPSLAAGRRCFNKGSEWDDHNKLFSHGPLPSAIEAALEAAQPRAATSAQDDAPSAGNDAYRVQLQAMSVREL